VQTLDVIETPAKFANAFGSQCNIIVALDHGQYLEHTFYMAVHARRPPSK
jgi:hypothetical protein